MNNDRVVYESLLRLAKRLELGDTELPPICTWIRLDTGLPGGYVQAVLYPHFRSWPKFSGNDAYPVTTKEHRNPVGAFHNALLIKRDAFWNINTQYGANRRELLTHVIHHLLLKIHADEDARANIQINL